MPRTNNKFGDRAFEVAAPKMWNELPCAIRNIKELTTFKRLHMTYDLSISYISYPPLSSLFLIILNCNIIIIIVIIIYITFFKITFNVNCRALYNSLIILNDNIVLCEL